jgi:hypothetical protein
VLLLGFLQKPGTSVVEEPGIQTGTIFYTRFNNSTLTDLRRIGNNATPSAALFYFAITCWTTMFL